MTKKQKIITGITVASILTLGTITGGIIVILENANTLKINKNNFIEGTGGYIWTYLTKGNDIPDSIFKNGKVIHIRGKVDLKYTKSLIASPDTSAKFNFNNNISINGKIGQSGGLLTIPSTNKNENVWLEFSISSSDTYKSITLQCGNKDIVTNYKLLFNSILLNIKY